MASVLVIEDDPDIRFAVTRTLRKASHTVAEADTGEAALGLIGSSRFDLVVTDLQLPDARGIDLVRAAREASANCGILVMTAFGSVESAVAAMKAGADDYLQKPLALEELSLIAQRLIDHADTRRRLWIAERTSLGRGEPDRPIGDSPAWNSLLSMVERYARLPMLNRHEDLATSRGGALLTILMTGETGSGKGEIARYLHESAAGHEGGSPFVHLNCSSLPSHLVESELFGHEKGAFTDAKTAREGLVEVADGGTLFLDEIGDMAPDAQSKLLLFLDSGRYRRVGGDRDRVVRCRVIAATNHDLLNKAGAVFRTDLYYRLSAFRLEIPPLRNRGEDAVLIAREMLSRFRDEYRLPACVLTDDAESMLRTHPWPGNVRELINVIQRAAMLAETGLIGASDLALHPPTGGGQEDRNGDAFTFDFDRGPHTAEDVERELVIQALRHTGGNVARAARLIGMQRSSMRHRIEKYNLDVNTHGVKA